MCIDVCTLIPYILNPKQEHLAQDRNNHTRIARLEAIQRWSSSLYSLEDVVRESSDSWRALMQRVERENVPPDPEAQSIIQESYRAMEAALEGGGGGVGEGGSGSGIWEEMLGGKEWNLNLFEAGGGGGGQGGGGRGGGGGGDGSGVIYDGVGDDGMSVT
jgi:hypothetical protein